MSARADNSAGRVPLQRIDGLDPAGNRVAQGRAAIAVDFQRPTWLFDGVIHGGGSRALPERD